MNGLGIYVLHDEWGYESALHGALGYGEGREEGINGHAHILLHVRIHTCTQSHVYTYTYLRALVEISGARLPAKLIIMKLLEVQSETPPAMSPCDRTHEIA